MIGDFRTARLGDPDTIYVELFWLGDAREARLHVSPEVRQAVALVGYPEIETGGMRVSSVLSYAVFLGMETGFPMRLTGDLTVWNPAWGDITADHDVGLDDEPDVTCPS